MGMSGISGPSAPALPPEDRLDSWKEIAAYLNRDVATVQRWEKREGMPVHRHLHQKSGSVYASRMELDAWAHTRSSRTAAQESEDPASTPSVSSPEAPGWVRRRLLMLVLLAAFPLLLIAIVWLRNTEYFWRNPIADARFQVVTDFDGLEQAATLSRDGKLVAFLSDRDGQMDVWVTQLGSGQFHNLTRGKVRGLTNPSVRTLSFSPDGSLVAFWARKDDSSEPGSISVWAVPTLGGQPKLYLEGAAEFDWSHDGSRLAYHTPGAGDPMFVSDGSLSPRTPIFTAPAGQHGHFPTWSRDGEFLYFVLGTLPDKMDIWRIRPTGGAPERITSHHSYVSHPVMLDTRTLLYLATDPDRAGPWLYSMDVERRTAHRLSSSQERYTSLAASGDGRRLAATLGTPMRTLWRMHLPEASLPEKITLTTRAGFSPRAGTGYLLYVSPVGDSESLWKFADGTATELWNGLGARMIGGPAISRDGRQVAFSVRQHGRTLLYAMNADGTNARVVTDALDLEGAPAWAPDGRTIATAALEGGSPRLFRVPTAGGAAVRLTGEYSTEPVWAPDGRFLLYSGADVGTTFPVKAVSAAGAPWPLRSVTLTRGARHLVLTDGGRRIVVLKGEIGYKNLWSIDLESGSERQLTNLPPEFAIRDFDVAPDGSEIVLERLQEHSDVVLLDLVKR